VQEHQQNSKRWRLNGRQQQLRRKQTGRDYRQCAEWRGRALAIGVTVKLLDSRKSFPQTRKVPWCQKGKLFHDGSGDGTLPSICTVRLADSQRLLFFFLVSM
jgi:hypothetical protein